MNGMFQVNILLATNLDFAITQKQSRLQFTLYSYYTFIYVDMYVCGPLYSVKPHFTLTLSHVLREKQLPLFNFCAWSYNARIMFFVHYFSYK